MADHMFSLEGKAAIVTGGTRGLGLAIAKSFLEAGAKVMVASEDGEACRRTKADLGGRYPNLHAQTCDVTDLAAQEALIDQAVALFGGLDIVVANAGISGPGGGSRLEGYHRVMDVNLTSVVGLCELAVPHLKRRGGGSLIIMSSLSALRGNKALGVYALSKAALAQLARNLAVEFGPDNIRANAIAPGFIRTDLAAPLLADPAFMERRMKMTPLRRPGEPEEVAGAALFLASPAGAFVTGHTLVVDGGTLITDGA